MNAIKSQIRDQLARLSPNWLGGIIAARSRRYSQRVEEQQGLASLSERLVTSFGSTVMDGPFRGLRLPEAMHRRHIGPFLAGMYESALHPFLEERRLVDYQTIIDVGSSFGYYTVGLAQMHPNAKVIAYDTDPWARRVTRDTATLNGCSNVEVRSACSPTELVSALCGRTLIVSDCEGYESVLFTSVQPKHLHNADLLIEIHPPGDRKVADRISQHFESTHVARVISHQPARTNTGFPTEALVEWRDASQQWLILNSQHENPA